MKRERVHVETGVCPVCGGSDLVERFVVSGKGTESGVDPDAFRPSSERYGRAVGRVLLCRACSHSFVADTPAAESVSDAYESAEDPVSIREEAGQVETARRALVEVERIVAPGRVLDVGCWTGSFLVAARERGWEPHGLEPSRWATERARRRGLDVQQAELTPDHGLAPGSFRLVAMCDVLEHLQDPAASLRIVADLLEPGGALYATVPDAGSRLARLMGKRWWSVLPMHLQHFSRDSMRELLTRTGFTVRSMHTHAKVFSARYYAERLAGYGPALERMAVGAVKAVRQADRLIAPDFRDRMALVATKNPS